MDQWANSDQGAHDSVAQTLAAFVHSDWPGKIERPKDLGSRDNVLIVVDGTPVSGAISAVPFWMQHVIAQNGGGFRGLCLVCGCTGALMNTIPGTGPGTLVPGAESSAGLININEQVFGYDLSGQLTHTPICAACSDAV